MFGSLLSSAIRVVSTPVTLAADVVTMGGLATNRDKPYTVEQLEKAKKDLRDALK